MTKIFSFLLLASAFLISSCEKGTGFTIDGEIKGLTDKEVYLIRQTDDDMILDTIEVVNGVFSFKGDIPQPELYMLSLPSVERPIPIFIEPGKIKITGDIAKPKEFVVKAGELHQRLDDYNKSMQPLIDLYMAVNSEYQVGMQTGDSVMAKNAMFRVDTLIKTYNKNTADFVTKKPVDLVTAYLISTNMLNNPDIPIIEGIISKFPEDVKTSKYGVKIINAIALAKKTAIGVEAPGFTMKDLSGKEVSLASFKGKYILVDFWASWCGPCRRENPRMVEIYNQFKGANFEMLGVSVDQQMDEWKKAVELDKLSWPQVVDVQDVSGKDYGVTSIPSNVLLDPQGKIIARNLFGTDLEAKLAEVLK